MMSDARVKCVPNTMIIGVGCGKSYSISNPTRICIRSTSPARSENRLPPLSRRRAKVIGDAAAECFERASLRTSASLICRSHEFVRAHPQDGNEVIEYKAPAALFDQMLSFLARKR